MSLTKFILCSTLILSFIYPSIAQIKNPESNKIYQKDSGYFYMNQLYSYKELGPLFYDQSEFMNLYTKSIKKKKSAAIWGVTTIGLGILGFGIASNCEDLGCLIILPPLILASITGTITLIQLIASTHSKNMSIEVLNKSLLGSHELNRGSSLSIGTSSNGIGFFLRF